jgi:hypothetical protein
MNPRVGVGIAQSLIPTGYGLEDPASIPGTGKGFIFAPQSI